MWRRALDGCFFFYGISLCFWIPSGGMVCCSVPSLDVVVILLLLLFAQVQGLEWLAFLWTWRACSMVWVLVIGYAVWLFWFPFCLVCSEFLGLLYFLSAGWCDWDYFFLFPFFCYSFGVWVFVFLSLLRFFFALICIIWIVSSFFFVYLFISFGEWFVFLFFLYCCSAGPEDSVQVWYAFTGALWWSSTLICFGCLFSLFVLDAGACLQFFERLVCWFNVVF